MSSTTLLSKEITPKNFSTTHKILHWVVAAIIIEQLVLGENMTSAWDAFEEGGSVIAFSSPVVLFHIWGGLSIIAFAIWRLWLRKANGVPAEPANEPAPLKLAAKGAHVLFYLLMFFVPLTGAATYFGGIGLAGDIHGWMKPVLIVLIAGHFGGALYQHFWLKSDVLKRMTHG